jgi:hypothetical protein
MSGHCAVLNISRAFSNRHRINDIAAVLTLDAGVPSAAVYSLRTQMSDVPNLEWDEAIG